MSLTAPPPESVLERNSSSSNIKSNDYSKLPRIREQLAVYATRDILLFLIAYRILNALSVSTFFQPDEYFQSLEPAWQMAFGKDNGAWITWVRSKRVYSYFALCINWIVRNGSTDSVLRFTLLCLQQFTSS